MSVVLRYVAPGLPRERYISNVIASIAHSVYCWGARYSSSGLCIPWSEGFWLTASGLPHLFWRLSDYQICSWLAC
jgi:hypothetical protein